MEVKESTREFLESAGLVQSYEYLLTSLCEHGLPTGDLYEFSASMVLKFEKKFKAKNLLNKPKAAQNTSPTNKLISHENEQIKYEDKTVKPKEDKKFKENLEDEKKLKKESKKPEQKKLKEVKTDKEKPEKTVIDENAHSEKLASEDKKSKKPKKN